MAKSNEPADTSDVMALAGLRRLVLHSRDQLAAHIYKPKWTYSHDAWQPWQIEQHAAMCMARQVLTLVADCLPGDAGISADEVAERDRKAQAALDRERAKAKALADQLEAAQQAKAEAEAAMEQAVDYQVMAEEEAANWSEQWKRLLELAQNDVPGAMRYLMAGGVEDEAKGEEASETEPASV